MIESEQAIIDALPPEPPIEPLEPKAGQRPPSDFNYYRAKLARIVSGDGQRLLQNDREDIAGLSAGRWAISILLKDPGLDLDLITLHELVLDSMALWLKVCDDLDQTLKLAVAGGPAPAAVQVALKDNLDRGTALLGRLQALIDGALLEENMPAAREISNFAFNLYAQNLKMLRFLGLGARDKPPELRLWEGSRGAGPARGALKKDREPGQPAGGSVTAAFLQKSAERSVSLAPDDAARAAGRSWLPPWAWLVLLFAAASVPIVKAVWDAMKEAPDAGTVRLKAEDFALTPQFESVDVQGRIFYGKVSGVWYTLNDGERRAGLERLRAALLANGIEQGILTGARSETLASWNAAGIQMISLPPGPS